MHILHCSTQIVILKAQKQKLTTFSFCLLSETLNMTQQTNFQENQSLPQYLGYAACIRSLRKNVGAGGVGMNTTDEHMVSNATDPQTPLPLQRESSVDSALSLESCSETVREGQISVDRAEHGSFVILLDWDDTLFPTTMLIALLKSRDHRNEMVVRGDQKDALSRLGTATLSLLSSLVHCYGARRLHIVTNSLSGWVRQSLCYAACISPIYREIDAFLVRHGIATVSAQSAFRGVEGSSPTQWKQWCFDAILRAEQAEGAVDHVVSIGDQWTDHQAARQSIAALRGPLPFHHVVKLRMAPTAHDLLYEVLYIEECFERIFNALFLRQTHCVCPVFIDYEFEQRKQYELTLCQMGWHPSSWTAGQSTNDTQRFDIAPTDCIQGISV